VRQPLPEELRKQLEDAERALAAGDNDNAIRIARLSQRTRITPESYVVLIRAFCLQRDLDSVNAKWREGRRMLSAQQQSRVKQDCMNQGIEL
jgi:serine/threonine-protein kinase